MAWELRNWELVYLAFCHPFMLSADVREKPAASSWLTLQAVAEELR